MMSLSELINPQRYIRQCADVLGDRYSPYRLKKPIEELDCIYDYDFDLLAKVEKALEHIDRRLALKMLFSAITQGCVNHTQVHMRTAKFLALAKIHNRYLQPMYPDRSMVTDPLVLLELGEMRCGHVARVAYDLLTDGGGYSCRIVQLGGHIITEVYYDNEWHYFDADNMYGGKHVMIKKQIPSVAVLSKNPFFIDCMGPGDCPYILNPVDSCYYNAYFYFGRNAYSGKSFILKKNHTEKWKSDRYYNWNSYEVSSYEFQLYPHMRIQYLPSVPYIVDVTANQQIVTLSWAKSESLSNNLKEYRVYISRYSRGWEYATFYGSENARQFATFPNGYQKEMYQNLFKQTSPMKVVHVVNETQVKLAIEKEDFFITVAGIDWYGASVGNKRYACSSEIHIKV